MVETNKGLQMTREIAIELAGETVDNLESVSLVMDIYDDLEAMKCENCKYSELVKIGDMGGTVSHCSKTDFAILEWREFSCSYWKANDSK